MLFFHRNKIDHGLNRRALIFPAEGHQHSSRAYCGVEFLGKPALGADVKIFSKRLVFLYKIRSGLLREIAMQRNLDIDMLFRTVCV